jgi:hypothetical protein
MEATKYQKDRITKGLPVYCSKTCSGAAQSRRASVRMAETNRKHASKRMKERNPMRRPESREKMAATLKRIGHKPSVRGGNGTGLSPAETVLADALGWAPAIITTGQPRDLGWPTHFKIDLANEDLRIAIEIDGSSHTARDRQHQDKRKTAFLIWRGWTVLRFSNEAVIERTEECCQEVWSTISKLQDQRPTP